MTQTVDLNADMGESFGVWTKGDDVALLDIVTSANIACGFHAGDWDVTARTMQGAVAKGVGNGAHPGFPDLHGFGRQRMSFSHASLQNLARYQIGAAQAMARAAGGELRHLKLMVHCTIWHPRMKQWPRRATRPPFPLHRISS